jgi:hypothetical protein
MNLQQRKKFFNIETFILHILTQQTQVSLTELVKKIKITEVTKKKTTNMN